ncbi:MAG: thiosulfate oxidation carrier complex protein SoxZ [Alphaproteobacteria bacterium]|nr:thiosulfate oxidation carrier complex protein SoxZ [Alphaproteobacteria bacterium]MBF0251257.1 thiosulfate oxidation carrier complex protein SoxZ [Alphaproteobacteria bacterium]
MTTKGPEVKVPRYLTPGEDVLIRTKAWHPMETGWRKTHDGQTVERNRIHTFTCAFNGQEVFSADLHSGVSANPYMTFYARVPGPGVFEFKWIADDGAVYTSAARIDLAKP